MNKVIRLIQNYLIFGFPFVVICVIWETMSPSIDNASNYSHVVKLIWSALGLNIMFWFCMLMGFLMMLVFVPNVREKTLRRLANMKERDEREQYITGKASRTAYISTLSVIILFLFFSLFSFNLTQISPQQNEGYRLRASIGMHFNLLCNEAAQHQIQSTPYPSDKVVFDTSRFSLSSSTILLILLSWQLFVFNRAAKREQE